MELSKHQVA